MTKPLKSHIKPANSPTSQDNASNKDLSIIRCSICDEPLNLTGEFWANFKHKHPELHHLNCNKEVNKND